MCLAYCLQYKWVIKNNNLSHNQMCAWILNNSKRLEYSYKAKKAIKKWKIVHAISHDSLICFFSFSKAFFMKFKVCLRRYLSKIFANVSFKSLLEVNLIWGWSLEKRDLVTFRDRRAKDHTVQLAMLGPKPMRA